MGPQLHWRVIILGSGPAGCTATIYAARANLKPLLIAGDEVGGQLLNTTQVENWPGDGSGVDGPELMRRMLEHVQHLEAAVKHDRILSVDLNVRPFRVNGREGQYTCDALIIATGSSALSLGLPSEKKFMGRGVSSCAVCDSLFFRDQAVAVVGGGNTAVEEAMLMSQIAAHVTVIHRRNQFRAEGILVDRLRQRVSAGRVTLLLNHVVEEILGDDRGVTGLQLRDLDTKNIYQLATQGLFVAVGHRPNTEMFRGQLDMVDGYLVTGPNGCRSAAATSIQGVFAAGDVQDSIYRQAVTSAGSGCMAALDADRYLRTLS